MPDEEVRGKCLFSILSLVVDIFFLFDVMINFVTGFCLHRQAALYSLPRHTLSWLLTERSVVMYLRAKRRPVTQI